VLSTKAHQSSTSSSYRALDLRILFQEEIEEGLWVSPVRKETGNICMTLLELEKRISMRIWCAVAECETHKKNERKTA
jgi:hypothetical protein